MTKNSPTPLYTQVLTSLKKEISHHKIPVGTQLPTEIELCAKYNVSRITIRKAISQLCEEGILERKQGKGTFVASPVNRAILPQVVSFHEACLHQDKSPSVRVIHTREIKGTERDCEELHIAPKSHIIESARVLFADHDAVIYEINHYSMAYMYLLESDLTTSLYDIFKNYGVEPCHSTYQISLVKADSVVSKLMGISEGYPLVSIYEIIYDQHRRPLHTSSQLIRGDLITFQI